MSEALQRPRNQWAEESLCKDRPRDELFFTTKRGRPSKSPTFIPICKACPVSYECLNYAIVHNEDGVWGGTTRNQRLRLPKSFVDQLRSLAKTQGWYETHP